MPPSRPGLRTGGGWPSTEAPLSLAWLGPPPLLRGEEMGVRGEGSGGRRGGGEGTYPVAPGGGPAGRKAQVRRRRKPGHRRRQDREGGVRWMNGGKDSLESFLYEGPMWTPSLSERTGLAKRLSRHRTLDVELVVQGLGGRLGSGPGGVLDKGNLLLAHQAHRGDLPEAVEHVAQVLLVDRIIYAAQPERGDGGVIRRLELGQGGRAVEDLGGHRVFLPVEPVLDVLLCQRVLAGGRHLVAGEKRRRQGLVGEGGGEKGEGEKEGWGRGGRGSESMVA